MSVDVHDYPEPPTAHEDMRAQREVYWFLESENSSLVLRGLLYNVEDLQAKDAPMSESIRGIWPGLGLPPKCIADVLGKKAPRDARREDPVGLDIIQ